jgi:hypothetical protein
MTPRGIAGRLRTRLGVWRAIRQARAAHRDRPVAVRVCWDLDNTLVGSGRLLRDGRQLHEAVVEAGPVPNMLAFFDAMNRWLPDAEHFILSARPNAMRADTLAWLEEHGLLFGGGAICLVPSADAKRLVWKQLAADAQLVIVDDLSYGHEEERPLVYGELAAFARETASVYIGLEDIAQMEADPGAVHPVAQRTSETLRASQGSGARPRARSTAAAH